MKIIRKVPVLAVLFLIVSMMCVESSFACSKAYYGWTWADNKNASGLTVKMCSSEFYNNLSASNSIFTWNGISSKVKISSYSYSGDSSNTADINIRSANLTGTTIGVTHIYKKNVLGGYTEVSISSSNAKIAQARIELSPSLLSANSSTQRYKTVIHEIGHALALMHPVLINCTNRAVLQQSSTSYSATTIVQHDRTNLIAKWGS